MCLSMRWYVFVGCILCTGHMVNTFGMRAVDGMRVVYSVLGDKIYDLPIWQASCGGDPIGNILGIPYLGVYGFPYDFRPQVVLKEVKLLDKAPRAVRAAVQDYRVDSYVIIYGAHTASDHLANMRDTVVIHPVVRKWIANDPGFAYTGRTAEEVFRDDTVDLPDYDRTRGLRGFSISVPMGIFDTVNVNDADVRNHIAVDSLRENQVIFHGNCQFSCDTPFVSYADRERVATFWLVARSPFSKDALVVFCSVALAEELRGPVYDMSVSSVSDVGVSMYRVNLAAFLIKNGFTKAYKLLFESTPSGTGPRSASPSRGGGAAAERPTSPARRRSGSPRVDRGARGVTVKAVPSEASFVTTPDEEILQNGMLLRIYRDQLSEREFAIDELKKLADSARGPIANINRLLLMASGRASAMVRKNRSDFLKAFDEQAGRLGRRLESFFDMRTIYSDSKIRGIDVK